MTETIVKSSTEYGWLVIKRDEFDRMAKHNYAGMDEDGTAWVLSMDETGATCLYKGVEIVSA